MTLVYVVIALIALVVFLSMGRSDPLLRVGVSVGLFLCISVLATWVITLVGDEARPGAVEVKAIVSEQPSPVSEER